jgi:hypothetical protein
MSSTGVYYNIAKSWLTVKDEDVVSIKNYIRQQLPEKAKEWGQFKMFCHQEWTMGTFIEIYILPEGGDINKQEDLVHLAIDREDTIVKPLDEIMAENCDICCSGDHGDEVIEIATADDLGSEDDY